MSAAPTPAVPPPALDPADPFVVSCAVHSTARAGSRCCGVWLQAHLLEMGNAWLRPVARLSKAVADCYTLAEVYIEHATRALEDIAAHPGRQAGLMGREEIDIGALLLKVRSWVESLRR